MTKNRTKKYGNISLKMIHKFKEATGKSPMQYKNEILMKQAAYILENTSLPVNKVSEQLGIEDALYFCKKFKAFYGITPTAFKKKDKNVR